MAVIIPRWEWRTFGSRFGAADAAFAAMEATGVQESDELYLLSAEGQNVKVRDELMDIKLLREVDPDGLERWEPVMKATFPITSEQADQVADALQIARPTPEPGRASWTLADFLGALAGPDGPIRAIPVHKRRVRYKVGGCTSEVSDVTSDGNTTRTIAIESEDAAAVVAAVRSVGLEGYVNISYPKGLRALIDGAPERYATIDVGTNSIKFHVAEAATGGGFQTLVDRAEVTRLGEGLAESGAISDAAMERTASAIEGMAKQARDLGVRAIAAVGTAGLRSASNSEAALAAIHARSGVTVEVIPGDEESRLAYLAVVSGLSLGDGTAVVFDTGGGSSQFTFGHGGVIDDRFSVYVGAARFTEQFGLDRAVSAQVIEDACAAIARELERLAGRPPADRLIGMGGAITNLTAVQLQLATYDPDAIQGATLRRADVEGEIERFRGLDADGRRSIVGLQPKRAEVILAGACIVRTILDLLGHDALTVSDRGLRHGLLLERFGTEG